MPHASIKGQFGGHLRRPRLPRYMRTPPLHRNHGAYAPCMVCAHAWRQSANGRAPRGRVSILANIDTRHCEHCEHTTALALLSSVFVCHLKSLPYSGVSIFYNHFLFFLYLLFPLLFALPLVIDLWQSWVYFENLSPTCWLHRAGPAPTMLSNLVRAVRADLVASAMR